MRRKKRWLVVVVLFAAGLLLVGLFVRAGGGFVDEESLARVQVGMSRAEVEELLGRPDRTGGLTPGPGKGAWLGRDGVGFVDYDGDGRVSGVRFKRMPVSAADRVQVRGEERLRNLHQAIGWR